MKKTLKTISKTGVFTMIITSFFYTMKNEMEGDIIGVILFIMGWLCVLCYFSITENES